MNAIRCAEQPERRLRAPRGELRQDGPEDAAQTTGIRRLFEARIVTHELG
jgi:hypothetical protein